MDLEFSFSDCAGKPCKNSALPVLILCDQGLVISVNIWLNLKCEEKLEIQKHRRLNLKEIFVQFAVTWNP